jgi:chemotaxis receptor (MCP) glutamine deamidase CheD
MCAQQIAVTPGTSFVTGRDDLELVNANIGSGLCLVLKDTMSNTAGVANILLANTTDPKTIHPFLYANTATDALIEQIDKHLGRIPGSARKVRPQELVASIVGGAETLDSGVDIKAIAGPSLSAVLNVQLKFSATELPKTATIAYGGPCIQSTVTFDGERTSGEITLQFTPDFISVATKRVMDLEGSKLPLNAEPKDIMLELTNILGARILGYFTAGGMKCTLGNPVVSTGVRTKIDPHPDFETGRADWLCDGQQLTVIVNKTRAVLNLGPKIKSVLKTQLESKGVPIKNDLTGGMSVRTIHVMGASGKLLIKETGQVDKRV